MKKHLFSAVFIFLVCLILLTLSVSAESGQTGSCTWTLDGTVLTISGNGATADYLNKNQPWGLLITDVIVEEGVTSLGEHIFAEHEKLASVTLPSSLTSIGV
ncbi:MAG: hypothetical protein IIX71_03575, partial [Ruminococcus sp.]|nr:hypothetical protein [Ruminococcus sp.]